MENQDGEETRKIKNYIPCAIDFTTFKQSAQQELPPSKCSYISESPPCITDNNDAILLSQY